MFTISTYRNESVSNIKFESNAVVLLKQTVSNNGNVRLDVLQFTGCPDTKQATIVKHLLKGLLAEMNVTTAFNERYKMFSTGETVNGDAEQVKTGIQAKRKFLPFLSTGIIYKTDSNGKLSHAVKCDDGLQLRDTALNIKPEQLVTLFAYNSAQFRSALHHTATAVLEQCSFFSSVDAEIQSMDNGLAELAEQERKQLEEQRKQEQEQRKQEKNKKTA